MPAEKGRNILIQISNGLSPPTFTSVGGLQSRTITVNNEIVDITNDDTAPQRELLTGAGLKTLTFSGSGVFKDDEAIRRIENLAHNPDSNEEEFRFVFENGDYIQGVFHLSTLEFTGEYNGARMYSMTFENASPWTFSRRSGYTGP